MRLYLPVWGSLVFALITLALFTRGDAAGHSWWALSDLLRR
jgi:hypothetical protein